MSLIQDYLAFVTDKSILGKKSLTQSAVGSLLDISQSTVSRIIRGVTVAKAELLKPSFNIYKSKAYTYLKSVGFSHNQAFVWMSLPPTKVVPVGQALQDKIDFLTSGYFENMRRAGQVPDSITKASQLYDEFRRQILDGIINSKKTVQDWMDYGINA